MKNSIYLNLLKNVGLKRLSSSFVSNFGFLWLLIEPGALFFPEKLNFGWVGYLWLTTIAMVIAFIQRFPRMSVRRALSSPDSEIEIKIGNLFDQQGYLVIGLNDVFDTELGEVIKPSSVQGQFLQEVYGSDRLKLDTDIATALQAYNHLRINNSPDKIRQR